MTEILDQLLGDTEDLTGTFSITEIMLTLILAFALTALVGYVYRMTHKGTSYSQTYVQTLVLLGMIVSVVMLVVGSNIARAFTLVGALSIVRFRNAVTETRNVGFIFLAMAIGMSVGTRFFLLAIITTIVSCVIVVLMDRFDWYRIENTAQVLRIQVQEDFRFEDAFDDLWIAFTETAELIAIDSVRSGLLTELLYSVKLKKDVSTQDLLRALKERTGNLKVSLTAGYDRTSF